MLFDHDAKVSGDSARFADFPGRWRPAAMGGLREGSGRLGYRSVTPPGSTPPPRPDGTWARCRPRCRSPATAPRWPHIGDARAIRVCQIAEDHATGNVAADAGLPA